jgi:hypothetical protein
MRTRTQRLLCTILIASNASYTASGFSPPTRISSTHSRRDNAQLQAATLDGSIFLKDSPYSSAAASTEEAITSNKQEQSRKLLTATIAGYLTFLLQKLTWDTLGTAADCEVLACPSKYTSLTIGTTACLSLLAFVKMIMTSSLLSFSSLTSWYLRRLEAAPLITKCVTGGMISFLGDYGAQWFEFLARRKKGDSHQMKLAEDGTSSINSGGAKSIVTSPRAGHQKKQSSRLSIRGTYNFRRGTARFLECLLISSPLMHYGYDFFERIVPTTAASASGLYSCLAALSHVLADSVFLDGIFVMTGIVATTLLEGHPLNRVLPNLRNVYVPTLKASVVTSSALMPLQFLSFRFLPVQLRVLSVNAVDLIWTGVVSFVSHSDGAVCKEEGL